MNAKAHQPRRWFILSCFLIGGCDSLYEVKRTIALKALIDEARIKEALRDVPAIHDLRSERVVPAKAVIGPQDLPFYQLTYWSGGVFGVIEVRENLEGEKTLTLYRAWINKRPSRIEVASTRAAFDEVYRAIRKRVPEIPPEDEVKEEFLGIKKE
jgi:hypothetical protein